MPFINSGQEVFETQPMNTGIDCTDKDKLQSSQRRSFLRQARALRQLRDPLFERRTAGSSPITWTASRRSAPVGSNELTNLDNHVPLYVNEFDSEVVGFGYFNKTTKKMLLVFANANYHQGIHVNCSIAKLREKAKNDLRVGKLLYGTYEWPRDFTRIPRRRQRLFVARCRRSQSHRNLIKENRANGSFFDKQKAANAAIRPICESVCPRFETTASATTRKR
ncbi:MAG: hypothetical protein MZU97_19485 [Bacillus subtilis]|nr:hypothetical protein [Bacillus subtilis]